MAKKKVEITDTKSEENENIIEPTAKVFMYENEPLEPVIIQSEVDFLTELLAAQVDGNWHGPAAGLIRERLKLLNG